MVRERDSLARAKRDGFREYRVDASQCMPAKLSPRPRPEKIQTISHDDFLSRLRPITHVVFHRCVVARGSGEVEVPSENNRIVTNEFRDGLSDLFDLMPAVISIRIMLVARGFRLSGT